MDLSGLWKYCPVLALRPEGQHLRRESYGVRLLCPVKQAKSSFPWHSPTSCASSVQQPVKYFKAVTYNCFVLSFFKLKRKEKKAGGIYCSSHLDLQKLGSR